MSARFPRTAGLRYLSVCSGIESASVAWEPLGWTPVAFAEIESFPSRVLAHRWPHVPNLGDFTTIDVAGLKAARGPVDLLVGGTPCQAFSVAGRRGSLADARGNLTLAYTELMHELARSHGLRWAVWENVPGVLNTSDNAFGCFLAALVGGDAPVVPPGARGWGPRAHFDAERYDVHRTFGWEGLRRHPPARGEAGQGVAGTLSARTGGGGGLGTDFECDGGLIAAFGGNNTRGPIDVATALNEHGGPNGRQDFESETFVATTLRARDGARGVDSDCTDTLIAHSLRGEGFDASEDGTGRGTPLVPVCFDTTQITSKENRCNPKAGDPCHPLAAGAHPPAIAFQGRGTNIDLGQDVTGTLGANAGSVAGAPCLATPWAVRRLTPRECHRLMGFPDDHAAIPGAADGPIYKALGNSKAVPVARWIGARIAAVEAAREIREAAE